MTKPNGLPPRFRYKREAAGFLCLSPRPLEKHPTYETGPVYQKLGGRVIYSFEDFESWAN